MPWINQRRIETGMYMCEFCLGRFPHSSPPTSLPQTQLPLAGAACFCSSVCLLQLRSILRRDKGCRAATKAAAERALARLLKQPCPLPIPMLYLTALYLLWKMYLLLPASFTPSAIFTYFLNPSPPANSSNSSAGRGRGGGELPLT